MKRIAVAQTAGMEHAAKSKTQTVKRVLAWALLFFLFSFLGWCLEKLWFLIAYGVNADRGFLTLPFCTVYGSALVLIRAMLGLPFKNETAYPYNLLRFLLYAVLASLIATAAELATGLFFEQVFHVRLWSYYGYAHEYKRYICLSMSVAWGALIATAMAIFWTPLERTLMKAPTSLLGWSAFLLTLAVVLDFCLTAFAHI